MKKLKARELMWMTLPVALLGGIAWWFGSGNRMRSLEFQNPLDPGPLRVEYTPFQVVEPSPFDVSQGYGWAAKAQVKVVGKWDAPPGWKQQEFAEVGGLERVVYRRRKIWEEAPSAVGNFSLVSPNFALDEGSTTFRVNLQTVPRDADEIRLRGRFQKELIFSGAIPRRWKPPKNMIMKGKHRVLMIESKPFDIQIKGPNEPFPLPVVSHIPAIQLVDARCFKETQLHEFVLQLRHLKKQDWQSSPSVVFFNIKIFDSQGHPVTLYKKQGKGSLYIPQGGGTYNQEIFSPQMPSNEIMVPLWDEWCAPKAGWSSTPFPLRVQAEVSDGECWPLKIDTLIQRGSGQMKDFGAAK